MATHARTVVPDPWKALVAQCERDARAIVDAAMAKAAAVGNTRLTGVVDGVTAICGNMMASNAKLAAEVASLKERRGWWPLGRKGTA